ncbi:glycosyltransferase family 4 protein [Sphingobium baderi]|uniref:glycosyltransferase family 4 protein n=1 Tax=Sphingobium baderi TaxID=1332080 RepID=UPI00191C4BA8|nr:glycosyltransferase family 4 protein [Sphingobium baderi]
MIADTFPPLRTSGAVQLRDLSREFVRLGHELTVLLPAADLDRPWKLDTYDGAQVLRLRAPATKNIGYVRRTLAELAMPLAMKRNLRRSPLGNQRWDGVIWYSPSIFHGPLVAALKRESGCRSYLIIRDIFPEWAADMGLMGRGVAYRFFRAIADYQYSVADTIGVQSPGNLRYFQRWKSKGESNLQVLPNWLGKAGTAPCPIRLADTMLSGRKVFVYAGNMGVAQNMDVVIALAERLRHRDDLGFLLVGRGSEVDRLKRDVAARHLTNVLFRDEIDPDEIPDLYAQCHVGIVTLDPRHSSHNIPGKFLTYMQCGLPVLAVLNEGNDLSSIIRQYAVGEVSEAVNLAILCEQIERLMQIDPERTDLVARCRRLFLEQFAVSATVEDIVRYL